MNAMRIVCRPLTNWPGQLRTKQQRRPSPFSAPWTDTQELLEREARMISGRELVIQLAIAEAEIRRDGWPYARAQPRHPGVTVVFPDSRHGRLSWSTDRYYHWWSNARAVAKSMEALRAADRHGVMAGRQYAGFRELGAGHLDDAEPWQPTIELAARYLADMAGWAGPDMPGSIITNADVAAEAYRLAAKHLHPDAGGSQADFIHLQTCKAVLDEERTRHAAEGA